MGVMACDRRDRKNVMCDHMVLGRYVCRACLIDLDFAKNVLTDKDRKSDITRGMVHDFIVEWFDSPAGDRSRLEIVDDVDAVIRELTKSVHDL